MRQSTVSAADIPQANQIFRVQKLVRLLAAHDMEGLAQAFADPRDCAFYFTAARILGFVEGKELLTPAGRRLAVAEGEFIYRGLAAGFQNSIVGKTWLEWAGVRDVRHLEPNQAKAFLEERGTDLERSTRKRRASTLRAWVRDLRGALPALVSEAGAQARLPDEQLAFPGLLDSDSAPALPPVEPKWPSPSRFPHNEAGARVGLVVREDLARSRKALIVSGYAALGTLIELLETREIGDGHIRILLGNEPFPITSARVRATRDVSQELRDYWLRRGVSVLLSGALIHARELVNQGTIDVRTAQPRRFVHAKIYATEPAITVGSSNFTQAGLGGQAEANARFTSEESRRYAEATLLAEGLWSQGVDYREKLIDLLDALLRSVTWQEALARACASLLEGEWAQRYVPASLLKKLPTPLWRHQLQGISQAMWVLENVGSVLVADATGSAHDIHTWLASGCVDEFGTT